MAKSRAEVFKPYKTLKVQNFLRETLQKSKLTLSGIVFDKSLHEMLNSYKENFLEQERELINSDSFKLDLMSDIIHSPIANIIEDLMNFTGLDEKELCHEIRSILHNEKVREQLNLFNWSDDIYTTDPEKIVEFGPSEVFGTKNQSYHLNEEETKGLFTELGKVNPFDKKDLLRFMRYFGLPSGKEVRPQSDTLNYLAISHVHLLKLFLEYKRALNIFLIYKGKNADNFFPNKQSFSPLNELKNQQESEIDEQEILEELDQLFEYLAEKLDEKLKYRVSYDFVTKKFHRDREGKLDLFYLAYEQLENILINEIEIRKCRNCGHYFEVTHAKQNFCHPLPGVKRSSCEIAYYKKQKR